MDIVIVADFCGKFDGKGNSRFLYLANMLQNDHSVELITSDFDHGSKSHFHNKPEGFKYRITMLHEIAYPKNVCLKRFYGHFIWGKNVKRYLMTRKKPDVIYCAIPTLTASIEAAKYCEKNNIHFIVDIQDLWPEAFQMVFHIPIISSLIFLPFKIIANGIFRRADKICSVSRTYLERALVVNKKCKKGHVVFLGTNLEDFDNYAKDNPLIKKGIDELWLGYCGTLEASYDIPCVIDALSIVTKEGKKTPKFIIMGDGSRKEEFEAYAKEKGVSALFTGKLPYNQMCSVLCECDITVNPIVKGSAASIINKHADYAAAGVPVLNTQESQEYRNLVDYYNMGFNCISGSPEDLADKLKILTKNKELRLKMGMNARRCAEEKFDRKHSYKEIIDCIIE